MSHAPPPADFNPFEAPRTRIGVGPVDVAGVDADAEPTRRQYLNHESSVKPFGALFFLGAGIYGLAAVAQPFSMLMTVRNGGMPRNGALSLVLGSAVNLALAVGQAAIGRGLRALRPWARWTTVALLGLGLLIYLSIPVVILALGKPLPLAIVGLILLVSLIPSYILAMLLCHSGAVIFSADYREVIRLTPHIASRTSLVFKIVVGLLVALIVFSVVMAPFRPGR